MSVDNAILLTLITYLFTSNIGNTFGEECVAKSPCRCDMLNIGKGYDLSKLAKEFIVSIPVSNRTFYFHPCGNKPLNVTDSNAAACSSAPGVSLCLRQDSANKNGTEFFNLGLAIDSKMGLDSANSDSPQIVFNHAMNGAHISVSIQLVCNTFPESQPLLVEDPNSMGGFNYTLMLRSNAACKGDITSSGLSTGSVLVIIFFVFSWLYFGGGALALKLLRGATGWEMLPNQKFWFDLPALVRDGIAFTFNGCKVVSYDQI